MDGGDDSEGQGCAADTEGTAQGQDVRGRVDARDIEARVRAVVVEALELRVDPLQLPLDEPLFDGETGADSIASLEIVSGLEREFGIEVTDDELTAELLESVATLSAYVRRKLVAGG